MFNKNYWSGVLKRWLIICILLIIGFVLQYDLRHGSLRHADFYETDCEKQEEIQYVQTKIQTGDTIYSLFSNVSSPESFPYIERLSYFYELNPHLQKQPLVAGDSVKVPIKTIDDCKN